MNHSTREAKGFTSVTTCCIFLALLSSLSIIGGNKVSETNSLLLAHHMGHSGNVDHRGETSKNNPGRIPLGGTLNRHNEEIGDNPLGDNNAVERVKRASQSGYIRFGKRVSPLSEGALPSGMESMDYGEEAYAPESDEDTFQRYQRAPDSSYVRFGKRVAPADMGYSSCVAYTLRRVKNRKDLMRMLVENGCIKDKRRFWIQKKKDGYIRFGK